MDRETVSDAPLHEAQGEAPDGPDEHAHTGGTGRAVPRLSLAEYESGSQLLQALSAPVRLAIVDLLADQEYCVHELVDALGISQPLVSQHLKTLRAARLVATERRGREVVYRLTDDHVAHVVKDTVSHAKERPASDG